MTSSCSEERRNTTQEDKYAPPLYCRSWPPFSCDRVGYLPLAITPGGPEFESCGGELGKKCYPTLGSCPPGLLVVRRLGGGPHMRTQRRHTESPEVVVDIMRRYFCWAMIITSPHYISTFRRCERRPKEYCQGDFLVSSLQAIRTTRHFHPPPLGPISPKYPVWRCCGTTDCDTTVI